MEMNAPKKHWETIYQTKQAVEVSWTQEIPVTSLDFIRQAQLPKSARIIDIGGGDSKLVDFLLDEGYEDISVLDISEVALNRAKQRLGERGDRVEWIVSDITTYAPIQPFNFWHDRAAFHFLTTAEQINRYMTTARVGVSPNGYVTIGTFSETGPEKCSGLPIRRYSEQTLTDELARGFRKLRCITEDHITPFDTNQNFLFCSFQRVHQN
ncbi:MULTISPECIES: class I SAM-dependent methyltransferase [Spirosoma]|uniref:class I SAM-dependent methyltransferase n=1 Tax=Spirosoma TaxID=107 RepID=UPI000960844F|nr:MULTISPECIES: class I SAM-dependent methyltransferase [Spirosoma]MBN8827044.1 class I SAM-dependent methyltransferase [Spirosoma sp.]OJW71416.1 MAG: SAM-dependent methyltransferase [Spirosoma sp. 48-14]